MIEYVVVRVYTYLGGHFVFFFAVCDKCLAYGCYCVLHSGAVLHALGLGQVQRFAADLHMLFDPLLFCEQFWGVSHFVFLLYCMCERFYNDSVKTLTKIIAISYGPK